MNRNGKLPSSQLLQAKPLEDQLILKDRALEASAEGITIADATKPDCPLIYVNRGFEELTGYSAEDTCGTNCRFLQGKDTDPDAVDEIRRAVREMRGCVVEILNYRRDGEPFWNRLSITPIRDQAGVVTHFVGIQSDVTARRLAEDALRVAKVDLEQANDRIRRDLEAAAGIQRSFLPPETPVLSGASAAWKLLSCDELAGDTLNVASLDDRYTIFYVADVSGHGVQAALLSATVNHWLSPRSHRISTAGSGGSSEKRQVLAPVEVLERLNKRFPFDPRTGQYFTIVYGVFDADTGELRIAAAGHPPPVYLPTDGSPVFLQNDNFPIGIVPGPEFREISVTMEPGDRIYLYSDGLVEAVGPLKDQFGDQRLADKIAASKDTSLEASVAMVVKRLKNWSGSDVFEDDISLLGLEVK